MLKVAAFVPLKLKSRRLPNKNFLRLGDRPLAFHIFDTLTQVPEVNGGVHCFTSQPQVLSLLPKSVELLMRPRRLDGDEVRANELFRYAVENIDADVLVLCHATGPFIKSSSISKGISAVLSGKFDCAFAVKRHQTYCWYEGEPLNYSPSDMAQTQDLQAVFSETSGFYVFRKADYLDRGTRIHGKPCMVEIDFKESVDIDEPADFALASLLSEYDPEKVVYSTDRFFVDLASNGFQYGKVKHISFDLDGVLIDSISVMELAWADAMCSVGSDKSFHEYKQHIGIPFNKILEHLGFDEASHEMISSTYNATARAGLDKISVFEGSIEAIRRLRGAGFVVSLVTSKSRERTNEIVASKLAPDLFDQIITPEDVPEGRGKPCPDPLLLACLRLGVDPGNSVYVGDMAADREAAMRAGLHFVYANWGFSDLTQVKDVWFNTITDFADFLLE